MKTRENIIHSMLNIKGRGLEIGPGYNPMFPKSKGFQVETVDHLSMEDLCSKYKSMNVDISNIENVDFIWQGEDLHDLIPNRGSYDFIFASHVLEHIPDIISFINSCDHLLNADGVLVLAVPDKRYCFDAFRPIASTGDIIQAHIERRKRHPAGKAFDLEAYICNKKNMITWSKRIRGKISLKTETLDSAIELLKLATETQDYIDTHGWQFVPSSLRLILNDLYLIGMIRMREFAFYDASKYSCEFFIGIKKTSNDISTLNRTHLCINITKELREQYDNTRFSLFSELLQLFIVVIRRFKKIFNYRIK